MVSIDSRIVIERAMTSSQAVDAMIRRRQEILDDEREPLPLYPHEVYPDRDGDLLRLVAALWEYAKEHYETEPA